MKKNETTQQILTALAACEEKQADAITILEMDKDSGAFTDFFIVCSGSNPRQVQAIADEVELRLKRSTGLYAAHVEGYKQAEWVLVDYLDFVVHIFSDNARKYYDLERLWKSAKKLTPADFTTATASPVKAKTRRSAKAASMSEEVPVAIAADAEAAAPVKKKRARKAS